MALVDPRRFEHAGDAIELAALPTEYSIRNGGDIALKQNMLRNRRRQRNKI
jgi:hypothetical protein